MTLREELHELIDRVEDVELLATVKEVLAPESTIVGYDNEGKAISIEAHAQRIHQARERRSNGQFISQEELEQRLK